MMHLLAPLMAAAKWLQLTSEEYLVSSFFRSLPTIRCTMRLPERLRMGYNRAINICSDAENCVPHPGY